MTWTTFALLAMFIFKDEGDACARFFSCLAGGLRSRTLCIQSWSMKKQQIYAHCSWLLITRRRLLRLCVSPPMHWHFMRGPERTLMLENGLALYTLEGPWHWRPRTWCGLKNWPRAYSGLALPVPLHRGLANQMLVKRSLERGAPVVKMPLCLLELATFSRQ